jgi:hypothetical protein
MKRKLFRLSGVAALLTGVCFCIPVSVSGQLVNWTGARDQNWDTSLNWRSGFFHFVPGPLSLVTVSTAPPTNINAGTAAQALTLTLSGSGVANVESGGSLTVGGAINIGPGGSLNLLGTGNLTSRSIFLGSGTLSFNQASSVAFDVPINGVGTVDVVGGQTTLDANSSYLGQTNITGGGILNVGARFALGFSSVSVLGGTLRTTSLVNTQRPVTINVGGNYTQGPSGILELGIAGLRLSQYDRIQAVGTARLGGTLNLFGLGAGPFAPSNGDAFAVVISGGRPVREVC